MLLYCLVEEEEEEEEEEEGLFKGGVPTGGISGWDRVTECHSKDIFFSSLFSSLFTFLLSNELIPIYIHATPCQMRRLATTAVHGSSP